MNKDYARKPGPKAVVLDSVRDKLGKVSDSQIARESGCSISTVTVYRNELGIPPFVRFRDGCGRKPSSKLDSVRDKFGKVSDAKIARETGLSVTTVTVYRNKLGIPPFVPFRSGAKPRQGPPPSEVLSSMKDRLGKVSDNQIARETGIAQGTVTAYRNKLNIPPFVPFRSGPKPREKV